jgi:hypothetical protein
VSFAELKGWRSVRLDDVKAWLAETDDVDQVALAAKMITRIMPAGGSRGARDLDESMRRVERRLAELIRAGQVAGEISSNREPVGRRPKDIAPRHVVHAGYVVYDGVSVERFEDALIQGRQLGSISRSAMDDILHGGGRPQARGPNEALAARRVAQVTEMAAQGMRSEEIAQAIGWSRRYVRIFALRHGIELIDRSLNTPRSDRIVQIRNLANTGHRASQIAQMLGVSAEHVRRLAVSHDIELPEARVGATRALDANRVLSESISTLEGVAMAIGLVDPADLDPEQVPGWAASLKDSIRTLQHLHKELTR